MSVMFRCPACGKTIQVADEHAGLRVQCPVCQQVFNAPREGESFATPVASPMSPPTEMEYWPGGREEGRKGLAIAALVLGVLGICVPGLNVLAIVLGVIALILAVNRPEVYGGRGLAIGGLATGAAALALQVFFLGIMLPSLARARELAKRTACAANLTGVGRALLVYAGDGNQGFPIAAHWVEKAQTATGQVNYVGRIGSKRGLAGDPAAGESFATNTPDGRELSTTRNLWTLVRVGGVTPSALICPSGDAISNDENAPASYWDFGVGDVPKAGPLPPALNARGYEQCSYGYQVPYGRRGRPRVNGDPQTVLAADRGPYGLAAEAGKPAPPPFSGAAVDTGVSARPWRPWNSPNHGGAGDGEGQNVLHMDGSVRWENKPLAGVLKDNIYTQWSRVEGDEADRCFGNGPSSEKPNLTPQGDTDALIYP